jgi:predicted secreted protein
VLAALAALGFAALGVAACSGDEPDGATGSTTTTVEELTYTAFSDASVPVTVEVGRRFAIMLPADPAHGWRWVVEPVDATILAPLGSEFSDNPAWLAQATTTTTTAPPPPEDTTTTFLGATTTTLASPDTTAAPTTTTTAPGPLVQIISYAGRTDGIAQVTLRYERIGTGEGEVEQAQTVVFEVFVGMPIVPPDPNAPTDPTVEPPG